MDTERKIHKEEIATLDGLRALRLQLKAGAEVGTHHSKWSAVVVCVKGKGTFHVRGGGVALAPGVVITMAPLEDHSVEAEEDTELVVTHAAPMKG